MTRDVPPLWSVPVAVRDVPETGRTFQLVADPSVRDALAQANGLSSLPRLEAAFEVTRYGREGLHVAGQVSAVVGQTCVVTLEPIQNEIVEPIDVVFAPHDAAVRANQSASKELDDDPPEPLVGRVIDLGAIATEFLIMAIDPHPRKPDAMFTLPAIEDMPEHPFAALAALKNKQGGA